MRTLELLSPAKNAETGRIAIMAGADAVYIGAPAFGARAAATNSVESIRSLAQLAHRYRARVYVTMNTILYDNELDEASRLVKQLYGAGVDALIVQDMHTVRYPHARQGGMACRSRLLPARAAARILFG